MKNHKEPFREKRRYPNGGIPSAILPDGTMLSFPIPEEIDDKEKHGVPYYDDQKTYKDLEFDGISYLL